MPAMSHEDRKKRRKRIAKYAQRHGLNEAAQEFGVRVSLIYTALREHSEKPVRSTLSIERTLKIVAMLQDGWHPPTIADELGASRQHVYFVRGQCKVNGIKVPELTRGKGRTLIEIFGEEEDD